MNIVSRNVSSIARTRDQNLLLEAKPFRNIFASSFAQQGGKTYFFPSPRLRTQETFREFRETMFPQQCLLVCGGLEENIHSINFFQLSSFIYTNIF